MGDRNCDTTESERGISCTEQYSKEIEVKLHRPQMTSITCLQQLSAVNIGTKVMKVTKTQHLLASPEVERSFMHKRYK